MKRKMILHPFLFAIYAVLGVFSRNAAEVPARWVLRPLLVLLAVASVVFILAKLISKDTHRAGLITTLTIFWLFFGHFHRTLFEESPFWNTPLGAFIAFMIWTVPLVFIGSRWAWKHVSKRSFITTFLNLTSTFVVLYPACITGNSFIQTIRAGMLNAQHPASSPIVLEPLSTRPDIYLIILDAYEREDSLREIYGFDNHEFIDYLKKKGFYVADQSTPNYPLTRHSLSSMLNMEYLDNFVIGLQNASSHEPLNALLQDSAVKRSIQSAGYSFVALPSATLFTQMRDADLYYKMMPGDLNEFEGLLLSSTIANFMIETWNLDVPIPSYAMHRRYILFSLDALESLPNEKSPKFVMAHIMAPHPPFVLDEIGNPIESERPYNMGDASGFKGTPDEYIAGYVGEVRFLNKRLMNVIDAIISQSSQPPVIIIQGDHGPGIYFNMIGPDNICLRERYSILNAYYFPDRNYGALYSEITPVNSFRVVFNQFFGTNLELLEDRNYYATWLKPYILTDVTNQIDSCQIVQKSEY